MDVLPPELWGEITAYLAAERWKTSPRRSATAVLALLSAELLSAELLLACGKKVVTLVEDDRKEFRRLRLLKWKACEISLAITWGAATFGELVSALQDADDERLTHQRPPRRRAAGVPHAHSGLVLAVAESCVFTNVHTITLYQCGVRDVGALQLVPHVELQECPRLTDISLLGAQQSVEIRRCPVRDVRSLATVPDVILQDCDQLADVSCLGGQTRLILHGCLSIADYRALTNVRHLTIHGTRMVELPPMENDYLCISACPLLSDVSRLGTVGSMIINCLTHDTEPTTGRIINISDARRLGGVWSLARVRKLIALIHVDIRDLRPLGGADEVYLDRCPNVRDLSPLSGAKAVTLQRCEGVADVTPLRAVRRVRIEECAGITDISALHHCHTLSFYSADNQLPLVVAPLGTHYHLIYVNTYCGPPLLHYDVQGCYRLLADRLDEHETIVTKVSNGRIRHCYIRHIRK